MNKFFKFCDVFNQLSGLIQMIIWIVLGGTVLSPIVICAFSSEGSFFRELCKEWRLFISDHSFHCWVGLLVIFILFLVNRILHVRGKEAGPPALSTFFHRFNLCIYYQVISRIHLFEHDFEKAIRAKMSNPSHYISIDDESVKEFAGHLFSMIKETIRYITGADVAVHVKVFRKSGGGVVPIEDALLKTYWRIPSDAEKNRSNKTGARRRRSEESFRIQRGDAGRPEKLVENGCSEDENIKYNSAYNYVFRDQLHFWIHNDLKRAEKTKKYASGSEKWKDYYNSLGVFILSPRVLPGSDVQDDKVVGVLVVDSKKSGAFEYEMMRQLMGYFSHRIYAFLRIFGGVPISDNTEECEVII